MKAYHGWICVPLKKSTSAIFSLYIKNILGSMVTRGQPKSMCLNVVNSNLDRHHSWHVVDKTRKSSKPDINSLMYIPPVVGKKGSPFRKSY